MPSAQETPRQGIRLPRTLVSARRHEKSLQPDVLIDSHTKNATPVPHSQLPLPLPPTRFSMHDVADHTGSEPVADHGGAMFKMQLP
jgi:hypothetical protein